eukprot:10799120-Karenia_brevis.AAC.1
MQSRQLPQTSLWAFAEALHACSVVANSDTDWSRPFIFACNFSFHKLSYTLRAFIAVASALTALLCATLDWLG